MFNKIQSFLEKFISPIANKLNDSPLIQGLSTGMMSTLPITLGVSVFAILVNLPIEAWQTFLANAGLTATVNELLNATLSLLGFYVVIAVSYSYAKVKKVHEVTAVILSVGVFLCLIPQTIETKDGIANAFLLKYLGSEGIFLGMIIALLVTSIFGWLMSKNLKIKMPDSVPPMVSDSLSPTFVAIIVFILAFMAKYGASLTSYGNVFDLFNAIITKPIMTLGTTPTALIFMFTVTNVFWFFGIHPSPIMSAYTPVLIAATTANIEALMNGTPNASLPYLVFGVTYMSLQIGGNGNTIGLIISMITAKSERFKSMFKLAVIPSIFNINEPLIFGMPILLNPIFFMPMLLTTPLSGVVILLLCSMGLGNMYNPTVTCPWIMPHPLVGFLEGGFALSLIPIAVILVNIVLWYPFFKMADKQALEEEQVGGAI